MNSTKQRIKNTSLCETRSARSKEELIAFLREKGNRVTPQLEGILDYILASTEHPSARTIHEAVSKKVSRISLATVYNILNKLHALNLITVLEFDELENRYEGDTSHHWNLVCLNCRKIFDYRPDHTIDQDQVKRATQFEVLQTRFELYGLCQECNKAKRRRSAIG